MSGLPGGIDYILICCAKHSIIHPLTEKRWNARLNVWIRRYKHYIHTHTHTHTLSLSLSLSNLGTLHKEAYEILFPISYSPLCLIYFSSHPLCIALTYCALLIAVSPYSLQSRIDDVLLLLLHGVEIRQNSRECMGIAGYRVFVHVQWPVLHASCSG